PALRLLGDVADSILVIPDRGDDGARAVGATDDVGFAWSGRRRVSARHAPILASCATELRRADRPARAGCTAVVDVARSMMSAGAGAARATGSSTTDRKICSINSGRVNLTLYPYARARERGDVELGDETDPLEPALRLLGDVADSILVIPDRGDDGARAVGATDDVGFAWSGRRRVSARRAPIPASCATELRRADRPARAGCTAVVDVARSMMSAGAGAARATGSSTTDRK